MPSNPLDRSKAYESNGLILDDGAYLSSGSPTPTHSANFGDWYFKTSDASLWRNTSSPSPGTTWVNSTTSADGGLMTYVFTTTGNTADKWLGCYVPSTFSNVVPLLIPQQSDVKAILFSNQDDDVDIDIQIFKNGSLVHTEEVRNKRFYYNVGMSGITFVQGDRMSLFLKKYTGGSGDQTAQDPVIYVTTKYINEVSGSGGQQNGV